MAEPTPRTGPDPWRVMADLADEVPAARAAHAELADRLDDVRARFGGAGDSTAELLDEVDRRTTVDVDAPVDSSRPIVPGIKRAVRKANAFISRHLAQQVTVIAGGLSLAIRQVDARLQRLERGQDGAAAAAMVPDRSALFGPTLAALEQPGTPTRTVRTWREIRTLPPADAGLVVVLALGDVLTLAGRLELIDRVVPALAPGGHLAVVGVHPAAWLDAVGPVAADLAPGRPIHPQTWAHLLAQAGGAEVATIEGDGAYAVTGRW